ncbi:MAG: ParB/RepB/Spo0J family partition protein [Oscillospiraceae bacterium]|jgi:ParB family chromosome partitioning protein
MAKKRGLGMGMDALFLENTTDSIPKQTVRLSEIEPNRAQPRVDFDEEAIAALADSIRNHGLLQPLLVRPLDSGGYQIVAGERRWRACRMLGLDEIPVQIRELSDSEAMQLALIENLQRENLNPVEEAKGYQELIDSYGMTQEEVAKTVGKSRSVVANCLRALKLEPEIQDKLRKGTISIGHAKALAGVEDKQTRLALAQKCEEDTLTVRSLEKLCSKLSAPKKVDSEKEFIAQRANSIYKEIELELIERLGRKVRVIHTSRKGTIEIEFYNDQELIALMHKLIGE